jgi:hypothetical protein
LEIGVGVFCGRRCRRRGGGCLTLRGGLWSHLVRVVCIV